MKSILKLFFNLSQFYKMKGNETKMYNALDKCLIRDRNLAVGFFNLAIYNFQCRNYIGKDFLSFKYP